MTNTLNKSEENHEWRQQWGFYKSASFDLSRWGFGIDVSIGWLEPKWGSREWGVYAVLGPFKGFMTWEYESRLYVNGIDQECAISPVNTPSGHNNTESDGNHDLPRRGTECLIR